MTNDGILEFYNYNATLATSPESRDYRIGWIQNHHDQSELAKSSNANILLIGDSIALGIQRYPRVWYKYFEKQNTLNFGVSGDKTQHVLWRLNQLSLPETLKYGVIHCGLNNLCHDSTEDITDAIMIIASILET